MTSRLKAQDQPGPVRVAFGVVLGITIGAICGFVTYWVGAGIIATPDLAQTAAPEIPTELLRPFYTVTAWEIVTVLTGAAIGGLVSRYHWQKAGLLSYISLISLTAGYVVYALTVSIPKVAPEQRWLSLTLLGAEAGGLFLIVIFSFYSLDAATRRRWTRVSSKQPWDPFLQPHVALVVPTYNEPYEVVEQTVAHLVEQNYPEDRFEVIVADDSTDGETRQRMARLCDRLGAHHVTREDRHGFKAGALNHVTERLPERIELVGVIDADYWVKADYLRSIVGHFTDPEIGFVQTPQDYRNGDESFLTEQYKRAEAYFYHAIMPSRNEQNAIIFCGTMGMIRKSALEDVEGFAEDQVCEDAEISVRLAANGWDSLYVDESFGEGLMPSVFEAYKKQFHRWAFGNVRILFSHTGTILRSKMTARQKFDYIVSSLHWFDGYFVVAIASILLYLGLGPILGYDAVTHHQRELLLLGLVPFALLVDTILRLHLVLRQAGADRWRDTFLVQGMWFSIKVTNVIAVTKSILGFNTPFVRTPKAPGGPLSRTRALFRSLRLTKIESTFGVALAAVAITNLTQIGSGPLLTSQIILPLWLLLYASFFLCAPLYAYLSYRTLSPMTYQKLSIDAIAGDVPPPPMVKFERVDAPPLGQRSSP